MKSTILEPICVSDGEKTARRTIVVSLSGIAEPSRAEPSRATLCLRSLKSSV